MAYKLGLNNNKKKEEKDTPVFLESRPAKASLTKKPLL